MADIIKESLFVDSGALPSEKPEILMKNPNSSHSITHHFMFSVSEKSCRILTTFRKVVKQTVGTRNIFPNNFSHYKTKKGDGEACSLSIYRLYLMVCSLKYAKL
jgi:thioredoxin-related protein